KSIRKNKREYYENVIDSNKQNSKEMWKKLKELTGDKKQKSLNLKEIKYNSDIISDNLTIANKLNDYFIESINELKILEEVVKTQLENFIEDNSILSQDQSGFRKSHSCETTLQNSIIDWRNELDKGLFVGIVYLDFARAFETINRKRLIEKMKSLGITGVVLKWFESYLFDRKQRVKFKNVVSNDKETIHGVPQGSKLGPLLFILFINDIIEIVEKRDIKCKLFADDTILYTNCDNLKEIEIKLNDALFDLHSWLKCNQLKLNVKKTV
ncbi:GSCOCG00011771001-RA-CDS, partial [Cotesia congregata]